MSASLALVARIAARGDETCRSFERGWRARWADLARHAPELASIDLVLAEALIAGAERTRFAEEARMTTSFDPLGDQRPDHRGLPEDTSSPCSRCATRGIAAALDQEISQSPLTKGPLLEAAPPYEHGATLADLIAEGVLNPAFPGLASKAVPLDRPLYRHQEQAIRKIIAGRNVIVATGTGSGKTESFLLPILDALIRRARLRDARPRGTRPAAVSDERSRQRPDQAAQAGPGAWRRTSRSAGMWGTHPAPPGRRRRSSPCLIRASRGCPTSCSSRAEMRERPPHILLTNYAMLEYLLLRPADLDLFEGAHGGHWSFIAVDEAHVYDGAKAAELAMLLRRLRDRVAGGRSLRCIATSATVGDDARAVTEFAQRLFDAEFEWNPGDESRQDLVGATRRAMPEGPFWGPLDPASLPIHRTFNRPRGRGAAPGRGRRRDRLRAMRLPRSPTSTGSRSSGPCWPTARARSPN